MNLKKILGVLAFLFFAVLVTAKGIDLLPDLDVPYEPTHPRVVEKMLSIAGVSEGDVVYDLGCGDGRIVVAAVKDFGADRGVGIDLDPRRIREAVERAEGYGVRDKVKFIEGDIMDARISDATVVAMYLLNSVNLMVRPRLFMQLEPGTRIVSHAFNMAEWKESKRVYHDQARNRSIYYWVIPAHMGGVWRWETETIFGNIGKRMELRQKFQDVSGNLYMDNGALFEIRAAQLDGSNFTFSTEIEIEGTPVKVEYEGRVDGDAILGNQTWTYGDSKENYAWKAMRNPEPLYGRWEISIEGDRSLYGGVLEVSRKNNLITASYRKNKSSEFEKIEHVYIWGNSIYFYLPLSKGTGNLTFSGNLSGETGGGIMDNEMWGPVNIFWTASRIK